MQVFELCWALAHFNFDNYWLYFSFCTWFISLCSVGITISAVAIKIFAVTAGIKKYKSIIKKKKKKKHNKIVLLGKDKSNAIEVVIS